MADAYGNVINAPGMTEKGSVDDPELLFSYAGLMQKGVTLKGGQGVLAAGTPLEASGGFYVKSGTSSTTTKGFLRTGTDTGPTTMLAVPVQTTATVATSTGTLADDDYFYVVTAVDAFGETTASNEIKATVTGASGAGKVTVNWGAVAGASSYNIYRGTVTGTWGLLTTGATGTSYADTGANTPSATTPPSSNTTGDGRVHPVKLGNIVLAGVVKKSLVDAANGAALSNSQKTALGGVVVDSEFGFYRF